MGGGREGGRARAEGVDFLICPFSGISLHTHLLVAIPLQSNTTITQKKKETDISAEMYRRDHSRDREGPCCKGGASGDFEGREEG